MVLRWRGFDLTKVLLRVHRSSRDKYGQHYFILLFYQLRSDTNVSLNCLSVYSFLMFIYARQLDDRPCPSAVYCSCSQGGPFPRQLFYSFIRFTVYLLGLYICTAYFDKCSCNVFICHHSVDDKEGPTPPVGLTFRLLPPLVVGVPSARQYSCINLTVIYERAVSDCGWCNGPLL